MVEKQGVNENSFFTIDDLSKQLNIKVKTLYAMVSSGGIPHFKVGRLIRFSKIEIDEWMGTHRVVKVNPDQSAKKILSSVHKPSVNIQKTVNKLIDEVKGARYTEKHGKPGHIRDLGKEVDNGSI